MAESVIPGLDGDLPPNRGHLPDSLQVKASNGVTVGYSSQQARQGKLADPSFKVWSGRYLENWTFSPFLMRIVVSDGCAPLYCSSFHYLRVLARDL